MWILLIIAVTLGSHGQPGRPAIHAIHFWSKVACEAAKTETMAMADKSLRLRATCTEAYQ